MAKEINWSLVRQAFVKREEIKKQKDELDNMDREVVDWLDKELDVLRNVGGTQLFLGPDFKVTAKVPQNLKCDEVKVNELLNDKPELQLYADIFNYKMTVKDSAYNNAPDEIKEAFAPAITTSPGKTQYEFKGGKI